MILTGKFYLPSLSFDLRDLEHLYFFKDWLLDHIEYLTSTNVFQCSEGMMTLSNLLALFRPLVNVVSRAPDDRGIVADFLLPTLRPRSSSTAATSSASPTPRCPRKSPRTWGLRQSF